jgi:hypothetical protein
MFKTNRNMPRSMFKTNWNMRDAQLPYCVR